MQIHLNDIASCESVLREVGEEEFVDHPCAGHPHGTLLLPDGMRRHDHAAGHSLGSHRDLGVIVQTAHNVAFGTLLHLIRWQVEPGRNLRMIEQVIVFAAGDKREASHIGEHSPIAILPIQPQQCVRSFQLIRCQLPANGRKPLAQFFPIAPVATVAETAEPLVAVCL